MILGKTLGPDHRGAVNAGPEDLGLILQHGGVQHLFEWCNRAEVRGRKERTLGSDGETGEPAMAEGGAAGVGARLEVVKPSPLGVPVGSHYPASTPFLKMEKLRPW